MASKSLPPIQIAARPQGAMQWICPTCTELHGPATIPWRRAVIRCSQPCRRLYRIGLGFSEKTDLLPPFNAIFAGAWNGYTANVLGEPSGIPAIGRVRGRLDWVCPTCGVAQSATLGHDLGDVTCRTCDLHLYTRLIIYRSAKKRGIACPIDWSPFEIKAPLEFTPSLETIGESA